MEAFDYLNDIERAEIEKFVENKTQFEAVRKVLLAGIYFNGTLVEGKPADARKNFLLALLTQPIMENAPIEEFGHYAKSLIQGVKLVETGFNDFEKFRKVESEPKPKKNRGK
jgi:serine protease inhibitor